MQLLSALVAEHDRIDPMIGALRTYVGQRARGEADGADAPRFVDFFRLFADQFHHAREESVLFVALAQSAELPPDRGPIAALTRDHERLRAQFADIAARLGGALDAAAGAELEALVTTWAYGLWAHIDAENSVLFPECERRLARAGVRELPGREPTTDEARAAAAVDELLRRYPPVEDPRAMRGEGCVICPNYGVSCEGVEREWWNEHEWDELSHRIG